MIDLTENLEIGLKPFYGDGFVTIYHAKIQDVIDRLPSFDAVITDPPYGETNLEWDKCVTRWPSMLAKKSRQLWCFGSFRMFWNQKTEFEDWKLAQEIVWEKQNGSGLHNDRFRRVHELAVHFYQGRWEELYHVPPVTHDATKRRLKRSAKPDHWGGLESVGIYTAEEGGPRLMRSVIFRKNTHRASLHPTQKPEGIVTPLIEYSVPVGGTLLDPFVGSGTTLVAAKNAGRRAVGIEVSEKYCEIAATRCSQETLQLH